jgi:tetratricopeptide (TPR) repeat protein
VTNTYNDQSLPKKSKLISRIIGIVFLVAGLFLLREVFAESMAEVLPMIPPNAEQHELALDIAPNSPAIQSWVGAYFMLDKTGRDPQKAIEYYKTAVNLSPTYYLYWGQLGAAYEMAGDVDLAEQSYRNMVDLSPSFSQSHWVLANCLLRKGDLKGSLAEFKRYLEIDPQACNYVYNLLSHAQGLTINDIANSVVPANGMARPRFAIFAGEHKDPDLAVSIWRSIPPEEFELQKPYGKLLIDQMIYLKHFGQARTVWNTYAPDPKETSALIVNGSFERALSDYQPGFGWTTPEALTGALTITNADAHSSKVAVRIDLDNEKSKTAARLFQTIAPITGGHYVLSYYCKGISYAPPLQPIVQVFGDDGKMQFSDQPAAGNYDWARRQIDMIVSPETRALVLMITQPAMPLYDKTGQGQLLLDDFSIEKVN